MAEVAVAAVTAVTTAVAAAVATAAAVTVAVEAAVTMTAAVTATVVAAAAAAAATERTVAVARTKLWDLPEAPVYPGTAAATVAVENSSPPEAVPPQTISSGVP